MAFFNLSKKYLRPLKYNRAQSGLEIMYVVGKGVFRLFTPLRKGPFKYYVSKKVSGWGMPNAYIFLHGGWVGLARCLRNQKN